MASSLDRVPGGRAAGLRLTGLRARSPRQELWLVLLLGAAGAGLIFLATRQAWAQVRTIPPRPLPASTVSVTGAALVPYLDALVVAGLATLAAILASRRLARRLFGVLLATVGLALAASAFTLTRAGAVSAASSNVSPETAAAGSVTAGAGSAPSIAPNVAGAAPHVAFEATGWQAIVVVGAIAMVAAGLLVAARARRMAVMSSRYDSPAGRPEAAPPAASSAQPADSAGIWESLSRGEDPTSATSGLA